MPPSPREVSRSDGGSVFDLEFFYFRFFKSAPSLLRNLRVMLYREYDFR